MDPRGSEKYKTALIASLNQSSGVWGEADLASIARYGAEGKTASKGLNEIRAYILNQTNYRGPHGRLVKWYGRSVKWTGKLNETTLYRQVLGPAESPSPCTPHCRIIMEHNLWVRWFICCYGAVNGW